MSKCFWTNWIVVNKRQKSKENKTNKVLKEKPWFWQCSRGKKNVLLGTQPEQGHLSKVCRNKLWVAVLHVSRRRTELMLSTARAGAPITGALIWPSWERIPIRNTERKLVRRGALGQVWPSVSVSTETKTKGPFSSTLSVLDKS